MKNFLKIFLCFTLLIGLSSHALTDNPNDSKTEKFQKQLNVDNEISATSLDIANFYILKNTTKNSETISKNNLSIKNSYENTLSYKLFSIYKRSKNNRYICKIETSVKLLKPYFINTIPINIRC